MAERMQVYKCPHCGNVVEVLTGGAGTLVCCGEPMKLFTENTSEGAKEKHLPVVEKTAEGWRVTVGAVAHPMEEKHFIEWVELVVDGVVHRAHFKPGDKPEVEFKVKGAKAYAREFCNLHGLWRTDV